VVPAAPAIQTLPVNAVVKIEEAWNRDLVTPAWRIDDRQVTGLDPALQGRMTNTEKARREALGHRRAQFTFKLGPHGSNVSISGHARLGSPKARDLMKTLQLAFGAVHVRQFSS
jgi:hypothetical protein